MNIDKKKENVIYIDISKDYVFKKIFNNPKYLKAFYEAMFNEPVVKIEILEGTELVSESINGKSPVLDCLSIVNDVVFHLEMQNKVTKDLMKRIQFYVCALVSRLAKKGQKYGEITKVRIVWLINGKISKEDKIYVDKIDRVWKVRQSLVGDDLVEIYIIEIPKVMEDKFKTYDINDKLNQMIYMLKARKDDDIMERIKEKNGIVKEIVQTVSMFSKEELDQIEMWRQEEQERAYIADISLAREEGEEIGEKRGVRQGRKQGAKQEKIRVAMNMYKNKFDIKTICLALNLSQKDVENILSKEENRTDL